MGRVAPSVIRASGTRRALTKGEVMVGGCSWRKISSPPHVPKRMGGSCFSTSLGDPHFVMTSWHQKKNLLGLRPSSSSDQALNFENRDDCICLFYFKAKNLININKVITHTLIGIRNYVNFFISKLCVIQHRPIV